MKQQGTIQRIEGKTVYLSFAPLGCCGGDGATCHCANATTEVQVKALNHRDLNLQVGDFVEVDTPSGAIWGGVLRLLVVPGVLIAVGVVFLNGWWAAGLAVAGMLASVVFPQNPESGFPKVERVVPVADFLPVPGDTLQA